ncbi:hypothetical protein [Moraxella bovis]|uniref:hypothetical protein n=1 Tax=Moraxella bovis TaxID=476 RepID=UPI0022271719|nr:hypothetical protein [Moraxella bovis]UZA21225.1 hypothetical protein LP106_08225 [Moraxella bovis]
MCHAYESERQEICQYYQAQCCRYKQCHCRQILRHLGVLGQQRPQGLADILGIDGGKPITEADKKAWAAAKAERESAEKQAKKQAQLATAKIAQERFSNATPATNHPYLAKKGVQSHGLPRLMPVCLWHKVFYSHSS